ncbi:hypothetical protein JN531_017255 (plasmid) [Flagellatimonas centrodinii]|uniref:hypothetical protein n=1 Tax=Flagellatimonas centrodinii TaxID=2806210 RepID=UPI001FEFE8B7|nr:hypothetical protein [Flagellatimonas centrodinii]ULQ48381.1 hypothetical protein JN531_017255 [Flagellatimonas centrodinii]
MTGLREQEKAVFSQLRASAWTAELGRFGRPSKRDIRSELRRAIVSYARVHFGDSGAEMPLSDHEAELLAREVDFDASDDEMVPDAIERLWRALEDRFGAGRGAALARSELARQMRRRLHVYEYARNQIGFTSGYAPAPVKGGIAFNLGRGVERPIVGPGYQFTYDITRVLREIEEGARQLLANRIPGLTLGVGSFNQRYELHEKFKIPCSVPVGPVAVSLRFFKDKTILVLPTELSAELLAAIEAADPNGGAR